jgi:hypothetical protein
MVVGREIRERAGENACLDTRTRTCTVGQAVSHPFLCVVGTTQRGHRHGELTNGKTTTTARAASGFDDALIGSRD